MCPESPLGTVGVPGSTLLRLALPDIRAVAASKMGRPLAEVRIDGVRTKEPEGLVTIDAAASTPASVLAAQGATILVSALGTLPVQDTASMLAEFKVKLDDTSRRLDDTTLRLDDTTRRLDDTTLRLDDTTRRLDDTTLQLDDTTRRLDGTTLQLDDTTRRLDDTTQRLDVVAVGVVLVTANEVLTWRTIEQPMLRKPGTRFTKDLASFDRRKRDALMKLISSINSELQLDADVSGKELDALSQVRNAGVHCSTLRLVSPSLEVSVDQLKGDAGARLRQRMITISIGILRRYPQLKANFPQGNLKGSGE